MVTLDQVMEPRRFTAMIQDTSILAFIENKPKIGPKQQAVYDAIKALGTPTDLEIVQFLGYRDSNMARPRRNDLLRLGIITKFERRICTVSGRLAWSWRLV